MKALVCIVAAIASLSAQQTRDASGIKPSKTGASTVAGRVVSADDGRPLRRVQVVLRDSDAIVVGGRIAMTNDNGQFAFGALPGGRFSLTTSKPTYLSMAYGMKRPARPGGATTGTTIVLADGQRMDVEIKMTRGSVISGVVRDASGQPANGVRVSAGAFARVGGAAERTVVQLGEGSGTTDDRGAYRIYGLPAGEYVVGVTSVSMSSGELIVLTDADLRRADERLRAGSIAPGTAPPPAQRPQTLGFVPVYHPSTTMLSQATVLTLGAGEERNGVDVQLQYVPTARIAGTVTGLDGKPAAGVALRLIGTQTRGLTDFGMMLFGTSGTSDAEGRYSLPGLAPGTYAVTVRAGPTGRAGNTPTLWAQADVTVSGEDQVVNLTLQQGTTISGRLVFEGTLAPPADLSRVAVALSPDRTNGVTIGTSSVPLDTTGTFTIAGVTPGKYRLSLLMTGLQGWFPKSVVAAGADGLDDAFEVRPGQNISDAVITLTDRVTEVSGRLMDTTGAPAPDFTVIIFSADPAMWPLMQARRIQGVRPAQDGKFAFRNLAPGDYLIGAADDVERGDWLDPAFLKAMAAGGAVKLTIAEGEKKVQDIRVR